MASKRVFKCNVIAENQDQVHSFLSHPIFTDKIVNPFSNVGVITFDSFVLQVLIIIKSIQKNKIYRDKLQDERDASFKLNDKTITKLYSYITDLEEEIIAE